MGRRAWNTSGCLTLGMFLCLARHMLSVVHPICQALAVVVHDMVRTSQTLLAAGELSESILRAVDTRGVVVDLVLHASTVPVIDNH